MTAGERQWPNVPAGAGASATARLAWLDAMRGAAVVSMMLYHGSWDADYLGLVSLPLFTSVPWLVARAAILAVFLLLAGVSLVLAQGGGIRWRAFVRRLTVIVLAALLITGGTRMVFDEGFVTFGVLHHIAVASVLGLAFLRLPAMVTAGVAAVAMLVPWFVQIQAFNDPWLAWTGLAAQAPFAIDHVPLLPWIGVFLAGVAVGRILPLAAQGGGRGLSTGAGAALCWLGRHSLAVYLLHQPVLMGMLWLLAAAGSG